MKILLVDDEADHLYLLGTFLQRNGHITVTAANGVEALANALKSPPDMVVSDILMPVMDGYVLCREWKKNTILQKIPFIFYTGTYTDPKDGEFALSLGADRFVAKSHDLNVLLHDIEGTYKSYRVKTTQPTAAPEERVLLKEYNETLVKRLEIKTLQIEAAEKELKKTNAALEKDIEEIKRAEEKLLESEEHYRLLVENLPDGVIVHSQGRVVFANPASATIIGAASPADLTGKPVIGFVHPDYREPALKRIQQLLRDGIPVPLAEEKFVRLDGTVIDVYVSALPFSYAGTPAVLTVFSDVTERKRAEKELKESESKFRAIFDNTSDGMLLVDLKDRKFFMYNATCAKMLGYTQDEFSNLDIADIHSGEDLPFVYEQIGKFSRGDKGIRSDTRFKRKDGSIFTADLSPDLLTIAEKKYLLLVFKDITERKRAEDALVESERKYRQLVNRSPDGIFVIGLSGTFLSVNSAMCDSLKYTEEELLSMGLWDIVPQRYHSLHKQRLAAIIHGESTNASAEYEVEGKDGIVHIIEVLSVPYYKGNEIIGFQGIARDITERKRAEETKRGLEAQLQQAQKIESIGTLTSGIAHDFNNILGIILGHLTLLESFREDPKRHSESVAAISKATHRGASLVKQLLVFARRTEALFESISINDLIREIEKLLQETIPKTITISISLQKDLPAIVADAIQIHQVLLNLCMNGRDAMPKRGMLSISTKTIDGEAVRSRCAKATARRYVQIEVADTGIGMDESTRQRIFEPFFTTKGPGKGTGLGLSVVFGIVENHCGFIDVRSAPGKGSSFAVYLPMPEGVPEAVQPARKGLEEMPGGTETILIIEDEEMLRELLKAFLVSKGYTVLAAEDGIQGVEMYQNHQKEIAIVLSDVGLPLLSGQDVFRKIREINPGAKVIFASGFFDPGTKSEMYRAGLNNFIQKPYMQDEVLQKIREAIDTHG
jgi:PAS domain S-box-containing protein